MISDVTPFIMTEYFSATMSSQPQRRGLNVLVRLGAHGIELFHNRRGLRPEALALLGESKAVAAVREQRAAQFFFQCGNAQPQSLPGQIQPPGGVGVVQIFAQGEKIAQLLDGHGGPSQNASFT